MSEINLTPGVFYSVVFGNGQPDFTYNGLGVWTAYKFQIISFSEATN